MDAGRTFLLDTMSPAKGSGSEVHAAGLITSNQGSDINTSCHSGEDCGTKALFVRAGWAINRGVMGKDIGLVGVITSVYC